MRNVLFRGDCLEILPTFPDKSINCIIADLPYGTTQNKWDSVIPFTDLWREYKRLIKDRGAIILFGQGIFSASLIMSNLRMYRYSLVWDKVLVSGHLNANRMPLRSHEDIHVFYKKLPTYTPQKTEGGKMNHASPGKFEIGQDNYGKHYNVDNRKELGTLKHPKSILHFEKPHPSIALHPTQKPVSLLKFLIKSYTQVHDLILDNTMGVGSTCVAAKETGREYIGIELQEEYYEIAKDRLQETATTRK